MSGPSIKKYRERLEGSYRLLRIKKIKRGFYIGQIVLAQIIALMMCSFMGMKFEPFFFPTDMYLFINLIIMAIMTGEGVYFRGLEMRFTKSKSRRYLIARNSIRSSVAIVILSILLIVALLLPATNDFLSEDFEALSSNSASNVTLYLNSTDSPGDSMTFDFISHHPMGLVQLNNLIVWVNGSTADGSDVDMDITVMNEKGANLIARTVYDNTRNIYELSDFTGSWTDFTAEVENTGDSPVTGSYTYFLDFGMSSLFTQFIPIILVAVVIIQLISISIMFPLRELYASSSIYSKSYVPEAETGVDKMSERLAKAKQEEEAAIFEESINIEDIEASLPPPPPPKPKPQPQAKAEPVTKMGDLDADLEEEPDVPCPKCGEMNSPHAAMCFVCGNPMARVEVEIDLKDVIAKGESSLRAKKYLEAGMFFDEAIRHDRKNQRALLGKGHALNAEGKWGTAIQYVNTVININPNNTDALLLKAKILEARGKMDLALEVYDRIMIIDPSIQIAIEKKDELTHDIQEEIVAAAAAQAEIIPMSGDAVEEDEQDVVEAFMDLPGIGLAKATALYEAGFTSMDKLRAASEDDIAKVKGISSRIAKKLKSHL